MKVAEKIGTYKKDNSITILQTNRWNEILERACKKGNALGLSNEFITKYFDAVHMESISHQNKITANRIYIPEVNDRRSPPPKSILWFFFQ